MARRHIASVRTAFDQRGPLARLKREHSNMRIVIGALSSQLNSEQYGLITWQDLWPTMAQLFLFEVGCRERLRSAPRRGDAHESRTKVWGVDDGIVVNPACAMGDQSIAEHGGRAAVERDFSHLAIGEEPYPLAV